MVRDRKKRIDRDQEKERETEEKGKKEDAKETPSTS